MTDLPEPTERELAILKVLWDRGESTVHDVYLALRDELGIVQNTVQAFLRTMDQKGLVAHRTDGRTFIYRPLVKRDQTTRTMLHGMLQRVFDGALDQLVENALSLRPPTDEEIEKLRTLLDEAEVDAHGKKAGKRAAKRGGKP